MLHSSCNTETEQKNKWIDSYNECINVALVKDKSKRSTGVVEELGSLKVFIRELSTPKMAPYFTREAHCLSQKNIKLGGCPN